MSTAAVRLRTVAVALDALPYASMVAAAAAVKRVAADEARRAVRGGRSVGGVQLRAVDDIARTGPAVACRIQGVPVGPWVWATSGTRPHTIGGVRRRRRAPVFLYGAGWEHPVRGPVKHPGAAGRGAWRRVQTRAAVLVPELFRGDVHRAVG